MLLEDVFDENTINSLIQAETEYLKSKELEKEKLELKRKMAQTRYDAKQKLRSAKHQEITNVEVSSIMQESANKIKEPNSIVTPEKLILSATASAKSIDIYELKDEELWAIELNMKRTIAQSKLKAKRILESKRNLNVDVATETNVDVAKEIELEPKAETKSKFGLFELDNRWLDYYDQ